MFKGLANFATLMRQAQQMGTQMQGMSDRLKAQRVTAQAGGGMVEVEANGLGEILRLSIDPKLIERGDREVIEDLVPAAVNQAAAKARELHAQEMKSMTEGMDLPGLEEALGKLTGGQ